MKGPVRVGLRERDLKKAVTSTGTFYFGPLNLCPSVFMIATWCCSAVKLLTVVDKFYQFCFRSLVTLGQVISSLAEVY